MGQHVGRNCRAGSATVARKFHPFRPPAVCHALHRFDGELEFIGRFADRFLRGRGVIAAKCAGQPAIVRAVRCRSGTLRAMKFDCLFVRFVVRAGHENGNAVHRRRGGDVI